MVWDHGTVRSNRTAQKLKRVSSNGRAAAFQAVNEGSIPSTRSKLVYPNW